MSEEKTNNFKIDFENGIKVKLDLECSEICNSVNKLSNSIIEAALISSNPKYAEHIGDEKIEKVKAEKAAAEREREAKARAKEEKLKQLDSIRALIAQKRQENKEYDEWYTSFESDINIIINCPTVNLNWCNLIRDQKLSEFFEKHPKIKEAFDEKEKGFLLLSAILKCDPETAARTVELKNGGPNSMASILSGCDPLAMMLLSGKENDIDPGLLAVMGLKCSDPMSLMLMNSIGKEKLGMKD